MIGLEGIGQWGGAAAVASLEVWLMRDLIGTLIVSHGKNNCAQVDAAESDEGTMRIFLEEKGGGRKSK